MIITWECSIIRVSSRNIIVRNSPGSVSSTINNFHSLIRTIRQSNSYITIERFIIICSNINRNGNLITRITSHITHSSISRNRQYGNDSSAVGRQVWMSAVKCSIIRIVTRNIIIRNSPSSSSGSVNYFHSLVGSIRQSNGYITVDWISIFCSNINRNGNLFTRITGCIANSSSCRNR